jgi:hypothetical protein
MSDVSTTMAKLAGIRPAVDSLVNLNVSRNLLNIELGRERVVLLKRLEHQTFAAARIPPSSERHERMLDRLLSGLRNDGCPPAVSRGGHLD